MMQEKNKVKFQNAVRASAQSKSKTEETQVWTAMMAFMISSELPTTG